MARKNKSLLSKKQIDRISEILGNTGVAWFSIGFIAPVFAKTRINLDFIVNIIVGCMGTGILTYYSIYIMKERKQR